MHVQSKSRLSQVSPKPDRLLWSSLHFVSWIRPRTALYQGAHTGSVYWPGSVYSAGLVLCNEHHQQSPAGVSLDLIINKLCWQEGKQHLASPCTGKREVVPWTRKLQALTRASAALVSTVIPQLRLLPPGWISPHSTPGFGCIDFI